MRTHFIALAALLFGSPASALAGSDKYQLTLWNQHNGVCKDRGTHIYKVEAFDKGVAVWTSENLELAWSPTDDPKAILDIPPQAFGVDQIKIYIVRWIGMGGGLSEVTLSRNGVDITEKCKVTTSAVYANDENFSGKRLVDKVYTSVNFSSGYWLLPNDKPGYVTIKLPES